MVSRVQLGAPIQDCGGTSLQSRDLRYNRESAAHPALPAHALHLSTEEFVTTKTLRPSGSWASASIHTGSDGGKADVVARALEGPRDPVGIPAVIARRAGATWMLTRESAAGLRGPR